MQSTSQIPPIKLVIVESPINRVTDDMIQNLQKPDSNLEKQQGKTINVISSRLQSNIKKIQQIERRNEKSQKKFTNFKYFKHNLINENGKILTINPHQSYKPSKNSNNQENNDTQTPFKTLVPYLGESSRQIQRNLKFETKSYQNINHLSQMSTNSLESCLKQINQVKRTIKQLKQSCKFGTGQSKRVSLMQKINVNNYRSDLKKSNNSASKYRYTNYRDLSQKKPLRSYDRFQRSQKTYNWIRNPVQIQQFIIDASQQSEQKQL